MVVEEQLDVDVRSLETCPYSAATFADILSKIQHAVDDLSLRQYSNLHVWVARLDEEVEKKLAARLQAGVTAWTDALAGNKKDVDLSMDTDAPAAPTHKPGKFQNLIPFSNGFDIYSRYCLWKLLIHLFLHYIGGDPKIQHAVHEIRITNQQMYFIFYIFFLLFYNNDIYHQILYRYLYPSIEEARFQITQQLFAWEAIVTSQTRLQSSRYNVGLDKPVHQTYRTLLTKLPNGSAPLEQSYEAIETKISEVRNYVDEWLRYQSLWDLQADILYGRLGDDITLWIKCLNDIK